MQALFKALGLDDRVYFLPFPTIDLESVGPTIAKSINLVVIEQALLNTSPQRIYDTEGWRGSQQALLRPGFGWFWTEHSGMNTVTGIAAMLNYGSDVRTVLGRWRAHSSENCVRTFLDVVVTVQQKVSETRIEAVGYGATQILFPTTYSDIKMMKNRRVEIKILDF